VFDFSLNDEIMVCKRVFIGLTVVIVIKMLDIFVSTRLE
jgi:hypothetical protein